MKLIIFSVFRSEMLPNVNKMKNGHFTVLAVDSETFEFNYFCNYPYELIGEETVYYLNKTWTDKKPICISEYIF